MRLRRFLCTFAALFLFGMLPIGTAGGQTGWEGLRQCESSENYSARSGAYGGAYQFDRQTWQSVGGSGDPASASPAEQDARAQRLYAQRGAQPWPVCGRHLNGKGQARVASHDTRSAEVARTSHSAHGTAHAVRPGTPARPTAGRQLATTGPETGPLAVTATVLVLLGAGLVRFSRAV